MSRKAFSPHRPLSLGCYPKDFTSEVVNWDHPVWVAEVNRNCWGYAVVADDTPDEELARYELVADPEPDPHFARALEHMVRFYGHGDHEMCMKIMDRAESRYGVDRQKLYDEFDRLVSAQ